MDGFRSINRRTVLTSTATGLAAAASGVLSAKNAEASMDAGDFDLIRPSSSPRVYTVFGGVRRWIPDPQTLSILGLGSHPIRVVSDAAAMAIPQGQSILPIWYAVKGVDDPAVYIVLNGRFHHVVSEPTLHALGLGFNNVRIANDSQIRSAVIGKPTRSVGEVGFGDGYAIFHDIMDSDPIGCDPGQHYEPMYPTLEKLNIVPDLGKCVGDGGSTFEGDSNSSGDDNSDGAIVAFKTIPTIVRHGTDVFRLFSDPADTIRNSLRIPLPGIKIPPISNPFPGNIHIHWPPRPHL